MSGLHLRGSSEGGVEEKKENDEEIGAPVPPSSMPQRRTYPIQEEPQYDEQRDGFQAHVENLANSILGSCGHVLSSLVPGDVCRWTDRSPDNVDLANNNIISPILPGRPSEKAPLSITDELRKLAAQEGRVFGGGMRRTDIPRFLGEDAVYSFDDDNISAISQHTLEELTRHGIKHHRAHRKQQQRRQSDSSNGSSRDAPPPSPTLTHSGSSRSEKEKLPFESTSNDIQL